MNYKISKEYKTEVGAFFKVPTEVVDNYLKLANPQFIMILLWVFCHARKNINVESLCEAMGKSVKRSTVIDALDYWTNEGVLISDGESKKSVSGQSVTTAASASVVVPVESFEVTPAISQQESEEQVAKIVLEPLPIIKPSNEQIMRRAAESIEIETLFNDAQGRLGRTIGFEGQCTLLMLHDNYGLPVEVILMLVEYCVSINKGSNSYIERVGRDWAEKDIDTIEKANDRIMSLNESNGLWRRLAAMAGIANQHPTANQSKYLRVWSNEMGFSIDMIYLAYEEMADHCHKMSFPYINKVLQNWCEAGIKTPDDVERSKKERTAAPKTAAHGPKKTVGNANTPSYDIEEYKRRSMLDPLVYEKRKKS